MYRYTLQPYRTPGSRYTCPECDEARKFTRYIDLETNTHLAPHVGKCDRLDNCGYHYTPKQYFAANPDARPNDFKPEWVPLPPVKPGNISRKLLQKTLRRYSKNYFVQYLYTHFDDETVSRLINNYLIGTSKRWPGATIFWQLDRNDKIRTGKIMLYDYITGKRVKEPYSHITWVHTLLPQGYRLQQCFFGEHLLADDTTCMVCIVESEKTALIASAHMPQYCWLAAGSLEGLTIEKCKALQGREVLLFPDSGAGYTKWQTRMQQLSNRMPGTTFRMARASLGFTNGMDIADWLMGVRVF